jgi:hypothetical protein
MRNIILTFLNLIALTGCFANRGFADPITKCSSTIIDTVAAGDLRHDGYMAKLAELRTQSYRYDVMPALTPIYSRAERLSTDAGRRNGRLLRRSLVIGTLSGLMIGALSGIAGYNSSQGPDNFSSHNVPLLLIWTGGMTAAGTLAGAAVGGALHGARSLNGGRMISRQERDSLNAVIADYNHIIGK